MRKFGAPAVSAAGAFALNLLPASAIIAAMNRPGFDTTATTTTAPLAG